MEVFVKLLREKKCLQQSQPTFKVDPIVITTDVEGRTYYSGAQPQPYKLTMSWCGYEAQGEGKLDVVVAKKVPETWGFRFRLKFYGGFLFTDALETYVDGRDVGRAFDLGFQGDFFHWKALNLNAGAGFRSASLTVGVDITRNFGAFAGYGFSFWSLKHNPIVGLSFSFW